MGLAGAAATVLETANYRAVIEALTLAKANGTCTIIDGDTGAGKTFAIGDFQRRYPVGTFVVSEPLTDRAYVQQQFAQTVVWIGIAACLFAVLIGGILAEVANRPSLKR